MVSQFGMQNEILLLYVCLLSYRLGRENRLLPPQVPSWTSLLWRWHFINKLRRCACNCQSITYFAVLMSTGVLLKPPAVALPCGGSGSISSTRQMLRHPECSTHVERICWCQYRDRKQAEIRIKVYMSQLMRLRYLSHRRPVKAQASLRIRAVSPQPALFAHMKYGSRRRVRPQIRHLVSLDCCACRFEEWVYGGRKVSKSREMAHIGFIYWERADFPLQVFVLGVCVLFPFGALVRMWDLIVRFLIIAFFIYFIH